MRHFLNDMFLKRSRKRNYLLTKSIILNSRHEKRATFNKIYLPSQKIEILHRRECKLGFLRAKSDGMNTHKNRPAFKKEE